MTLQLIARTCNRSLLKLNISKNKNLNEDGFSWLAGTIGHFKAPCKKLETLNAEDVRLMKDRGLIALGKGCHSLMFVNLSGCSQITDIGVTALARGCKRLRVLNLNACILLGDATMKALGENCKNLKSLNMSRCVEVTDLGLNHLASGCHEIQSLNISGCRHVTELGICHIGVNCRSLNLLNVSGCMKITQAGLEQLVLGLKYVTLAKSFFGFIPEKNAISHKLDEQMELIRQKAAIKIQALFRGHLDRKYYMKRLYAYNIEKSARLVQRNWRGHQAAETY